MEKNMGNEIKWKLGIYSGLGFPKLRVPFWNPYNEDWSILGSILRSYFVKLP